MLAFVYCGSYVLYYKCIPYDFDQVMIFTLLIVRYSDYFTSAYHMILFNGLFLFFLLLNNFSLYYELIFCLSWFELCFKLYSLSIPPFPVAFLDCFLEAYRFLGPL